MALIANVTGVKWCWKQMADAELMLGVGTEWWALEPSSNNENNKVQQSTWGVRDGNDGDIESNAKGWQLPGMALGPTDNNRPAMEIKTPSSKQQHSHAGLMATAL